MNRHLSPDRKATRAGFTFTELVVTVSIVLLMLLLLLPAVRSPGRVAYKLECLNNLRQLALATSAYATAQGGKVMALSAPGPGQASDISLGWPIHLLPYLDNQGVFDYLNDFKTKPQAHGAVKIVLSSTFKCFQCPLDAKHFKQPGGISFGANIGYGAWRGTPDGVVPHYDFGAGDHGVAAIDWNGNGHLAPTDREVAQATGVFWSTDENVPQLTYDDIINGDGSGQTILLTESMNLPPMHLAGPGGDGQNPGALDLGIGIGYDSLRLSKRAKPSLFVDSKTEATADYSAYFQPNSKRGAALGKWPAASSMHKGGFNVVFADGHATFITNDIHWTVWASLQTSRGMKYGEAGLSSGIF